MSWLSIACRSEDGSAGIPRLYKHPFIVDVPLDEHDRERPEHEPLPEVARPFVRRAGGDGLGADLHARPGLQVALVGVEQVDREPPLAALPRRLIDARPVGLA